MNAVEMKYLTLGVMRPVKKLSFGITVVMF